MVRESPTEQCNRIIDALGLTELGYQATITTHGGHISVQLDHARVKANVGCGPEGINRGEECQVKPPFVVATNNTWVE